MPWFDAPIMQYPRRWSERSLDYRLFCIWIWSLAAAIILGGSLFKKIPAPVFYGPIAAGAVVVISLSIANRRRRNWHWPGTTTEDTIKAIGAVVLWALGFYVIFRFFRDPWSRPAVPIILFLLSMAALNILVLLKLLLPSEIGFQSHCYDPLAGPPIVPPAAPATPEEPQWKRIARGAYYAVCVAVLLNWLAFFYVNENYTRDGAQYQVATHTRPNNGHKAIIHLTPQQKRIENLMVLGMVFGTPALMLGALFAQFALGVTLFPYQPTPRGIFDPKDTVE